MTKETRTFNLKPVKVPKLRHQTVINTIYRFQNQLTFLIELKIESSNVKDRYQLPGIG